MLVKNSAKKLRKILVSLLLVLGLFTSAFTGLVFNLKPSNKSFAESIDKSSSFISNYNFSSTSSAKTPPTPNNWTEKSAGINNLDRITRGVFNSYSAANSSDEDYLENYKLLESPGFATNNENLSSTDAKNKSLMINSPFEYGRLGFESPDFTLNKNSYYQIEVVLKTITADNESNPNNSETNYENFDSRASIYLTDTTNEETITSFEMVDSNDNPQHITEGWAIYTMYVSTKSFADISASLELYLGSKTESTIGPVFFNQVRILQISNDRYLNSISAIDEANTRVCSLNDSVITSPVTNSNFEIDWRNGWSEVAKGSTGTTTVEIVEGDNASASPEFSNADLDSNDVPYTNNSSSSNNFVLFMHNSEANYVGVESEEITISQHGYYKLSVWAWCNSSSTATPTIVLVDKSDRELTSVNASVSTSATKSNSLTNGWVEYSFYIYGDAYKDVTVALQLWLGTEDTPSGEGDYVFYDEVTLQQLAYADYNTAKNSNLLSYTSSDSEKGVNNYTFDETQSETAAIVYPLAPAKWTPTTANTGTISGVVNIKNEIFNTSSANGDLSIGSDTPPSHPQHLPLFEDNVSNNVLMIGSSTPLNNQYYTSENISLTASTYYILEIWYSADTAGSYIKLLNSHGYAFYTQNLPATTGWQKIQVALHTSANAEEYTLQLGLKDYAGYTFFDELSILSSGAEITYNSIVPSTTNFKIDLTNINFENTVNGNGLQALNGFTAPVANDNVNAGIANLDDGYFEITGANSGKFALVVDSEEVTQYFVESNEEISLTEGSFYKISVFVKTYNLSNLNYGAKIMLAGEGLDHCFENINTQIDLNHNEWTEYTFYLKATASTTASLQLGLGTTDKHVSGIALFDDITVTTLTDETTFNSEIEGKENSEYALIIKSIDIEDETEEATEENDEFKGSFNWAIIPSLITAVVLIVALVASMLRKVNWKKHSKKIKTSYDRRKTVEKDLDRKERIALRQQIISELQQQLKAIDDEVAAYKAICEEHERITKEKYKEEHDALIERKRKITAEKEQLLRERNERLAKDKNAYTAKGEEEFNKYIKKLEVQEAKQKNEIDKKERSIVSNNKAKEAKLAKYIAKQNAIKAEIARVDKEIEMIAKEEEAIWAEYKRAKQEAKEKKKAYKEGLKQEKLAKTTKKANTSVEKKEQAVDNVEQVESDVEITPPDTQE